GCVGLPGLNRNLTRFDFTAFLLVKILHDVASKGEKAADRPDKVFSPVYVDYQNFTALGIRARGKKRQCPWIILAVTSCLPFALPAEIFR
ncbi:MAG: hypothetical protein KDB01_18420, partial [Planctomycetaceae bacterium]|nr:hypothetical protein [Planctomycetaceae bacterium]